jgi:hypothetical protein
MKFGWQPMQKVIRTHTDTDDAGCPRTRRSTTCVIVQHGKHFLSGLSATQPATTLSSTESEYAGGIRGAVEAVYTRNVLAFYGHEVKIELYVDNSSARSMMNRLGAGKATKHIARRFFWIQQLVRAKLLRICCVSGVDNVADVGTKYLDQNTLLRLLGMIGMIYLPARAASVTVTEKKKKEKSTKPEEYDYENEAKIAYLADGMLGSTVNVLTGGAVESFFQAEKGIQIMKNMKVETDCEKAFMSGFLLALMLMMVTMKLMAYIAKLAKGAKLASNKDLAGRLEIDKMYRAGTRKVVHSEKDCQHIKHLTDESRVQVDMCLDCRKAVNERAADQM